MENVVKNTSVVFVGAGNLATHLARALHKAGFRIQQVYSRTEEAARVLAKCVDAGFTTDLEALSADAALYIVSLKDAAFTELLPEIVAGREHQGMWVHTAGSIPMSVWKNSGVERYGVFYPMQTFSKQREVDFSQIPLFVEANRPSDVQMLKEIAGCLTTKVMEADSEQRKSLHLAAVFACNFTNHMYALTEELLQKYNLPFDVMLPLIDETARKVHELHPKNAQTGPAVRYDENVMNAHLRMLEGEPCMQEIYKLISQSIHILDKKNNDEYHKL